MEGFDPHLEAVRMAVSSFRPLALRAISEVQAALRALSAIAAMLSEPEPWQLVSDGQRCAARVGAFLDQALGALDPYTDISLPPQKHLLLDHYHAPGRVLLAMEGGCTQAGWQARVETQRLAGVRALYIAIGAAVADDLEQLVDLEPVLSERMPKDGPARQYLEAFRSGLERLSGLVELLADTQRVVWYTAADGRRLMDLFQSAEPR